MAGQVISFFLLLLVLVISRVASAGPPPPYFYPSTVFKSMGFYQVFRNQWGANHQRLQQDNLTIWLDQSCGSGFKSIQPYRSGYFGASIKVQPGYTAGVITSFYLSNGEDHPGDHDEVDIEFLGTTFGKPYVLQTNVYVRGSGDGKNIIGRELKYHLWFDPTLAFHHYTIFWSPMEIIFLVDDVPIRRYPKRSDDTFPMRPMYLYGSIWDASSWATEQGKYKADYKYQPFVGQYTNFKASGCSASFPTSCHHGSVSPHPYGGLTRKQFESMSWVGANSLIYNYCKDPSRDHSLTPECSFHYLC